MKPCIFRLLIKLLLFYWSTSSSPSIRYEALLSCSHSNSNDLNVHRNGITIQSDGLTQHITIRQLRLAFLSANCYIPGFLNIGRPQRHHYLQRTCLGYYYDGHAVAHTPRRAAHYLYWLRYLNKIAPGKNLGLLRQTVIDKDYYHVQLALPGRYSTCLSMFY